MNKLLNKKNINIIFAFILSNLVAFFTISIIPAKAAQPNMLFLSLLNLLFVNLVLLFAIFTYIIYPISHQKTKRKPISNYLLDKNIKFLSYAPIVGIILIMYDRIVLRGIDYTQGLRHARYQWLDTIGGSLFGIIGNLLVPFGYLGIFFLIIYYNRIPKKKQFLLIIAIILGIIGHAALNGGRSNVLLGLVMMIIAVIFKNKSKIHFFELTYGKIKLIIIFVISIVYVGYIIASSATMGFIDIKTLAILGTNDLYGQVDQEFYASKHSDIIYMLIYGLSYLYHGQWTAEISYSMLSREGISSIPPFFHTLIEALQEPYYFSGVYISLPGAFYYDFGFWGVIGLSSLLGILMGIVFIFITYAKSIGGIKMAFIISILYIVIFSPIAPAYYLGYFNFIIISFIMLDLINIVFFRKKINFID